MRAFKFGQPNDDQSMDVIPPNLVSISNRVSKRRNQGALVIIEAKFEEVKDNDPLGYPVFNDNQQNAAGTFGKRKMPPKPVPSAAIETLRIARYLSRLVPSGRFGEMTVGLGFVMLAILYLSWSVPVHRDPVDGILTGSVKADTAGGDIRSVNLSGVDHDAGISAKAVANDALVAIYGGGHQTDSLIQVSPSISRVGDQ